MTGATILRAPVDGAVPFGVTQASDPDPGDTLTFAWSFDDGATAPGAQVTHPFVDPRACTGGP